MRKNLLFCLILIVLCCNSFAEELIPFLFNNKWGYVNTELNVVIEPKFYNIRFLPTSHFTSEGFAIVIVSYDPSSYLSRRIDGIINKNGEIILRTSPGVMHVYSDLYSFRALSDDESIILRVSDNKIIARQASAVFQASEDGYIITAFPREEKYLQFIDFTGRKVLSDLNMKKPSYSFFEQRAIITNAEWDPQIIDMEGNIVGNNTFSRLGQKYSEGLVSAKSISGVTGYVDKSGNFAFTLPFIVTDLPETTNFSGGYAAIKTKNNPSIWKIINAKGQIVSGDIQVNQMRDFSSGFSLVSIYNIGKNENKYGYVDTRGEYLVKPILEVADDFKNGYARIIYNGREGLLKTNGKVIWSSDIMNGNSIEKNLN